MAIAVSRKSPTTAADLLKLIESLGGIDPARVRLKPPPGRATEADLLSQVNGDRKHLCELDNGVLVEKPTGSEESLLANWISRRLGNFVEMHRVGLVSGPDHPVRMRSGRVLLPDVLYFSKSRWRSLKNPKRPITEVAPDLVVEILSRKNTKAEMARKRLGYFASGVRLVWEVDPRRRIVSVFTSAAEYDRLSASGTLTGGDVLPGFKLRLTEMFADPLG